MLTHTSSLLRQELYNDAKTVSESYQKEELYNTNPLLLSIAGHACYVLGDVAGLF